MSRCRNTRFGDVGPAEVRTTGCLADRGITAGVTPTTYDPGGVVRRDQMTAFLSRWLDHAVEMGHADPA